MATASINKTIWTFALVGVLGFLVWKLAPILFKKLKGDSSSGGSSGGVGSSSPYPYEPDYGTGQQSQNPLASLNFGSGNGSQGSGGSGGGSGFAAWLNSVLSYGQNAASQMSPESDFNGLNTLDSQGLPLEPLQNLTNLPSWSPDDPNAPWNSGTSAYTSVVSTDTNEYISSAANTSADGGEDYGDDASYDYSSDGGY